MASNVINSSLNKIQNVNTLNELQNVETIASIFSHKKDLSTDDQPTFVLLVGSPGVGKTTQIKKNIKKYTKKDYDNFYNVSLDSIIERIEPYREVTKTLYNVIVERRGNKPLTNQNYANLSNVYLPTVTSKKSNFGLTQKYQKSLEKITNRLNEEERKEKIKNSDEEHKQATKNKSEEDHKNVDIHHSEHESKSAASTSPTKRKSMSSRKASTSTKKKNSKIQHQELKKLTELLNDGLKYGIEHNYNIIYDTTFDGTMKKLTDIVLPMLEEHTKKTQIKYKIFVILVKPELLAYKKVNNTFKILTSRNIVYERLMGRHQKMINEGYIRAINPKKIQDFIKDNKEGYNQAKKYIKDDKLYETKNNVQYDHSDFEFIPITN
jgi:flagellar biosynthesis GTPase FlhF